MLPKSFFSLLKERAGNFFSRNFMRNNGVAIGGTFVGGTGPLVASNPVVDSPSTTDEPRFGGFARLPPEIKSRIGVEAALADHGGLLAGIGTLRQVSHTASSDLVGHPELRHFWQTAATGPAHLAGYVHEQMYPKDGLPEHAEHMGRGNDQPVYASEHVENALRSWKLLSEDAKSQVVGDVLAISDYRIRHRCIEEFARNKKNVEPHHGRPILRNAIEMLGEVAASPDKWDVIHITDTIIDMRKYAGRQEISRLEEIFHKHPGCREIFNSAMSGGHRVRSGTSDDIRLNTSHPQDGKTLNFSQLFTEIVDHIENTSFSEREKSSKVFSALAGLSSALENSAAEARTKLVVGLSQVPGDTHHPASSARMDLARVPRTRVDHSR